jgi:hypothetical protein
MKLSGLILSLFIFLAPISQAQWSPLRRISTAGGGYNPDIIANGDTLHAVYEGLASFGRTVVWHVRSLDGGRTWSTPQIITDTANTNSIDFPKVAIYQNKVAIFWKQNFIRGYIRDNIGFRLSIDGGIRWANCRYILNPNAEFLEYYDIAVSDSIINAVYAHQEETYYYHFTYIRSTDFGSTWSSPQEIFQSEDAGTLAAASYGDRVNVVWTGNFDYNRHWEVYQFRSTDGGISWSGNDTITAPSDNISSIFPKLAVDETGKLYLAWNDLRYSPNFGAGDIFLESSADGGIIWSSPQEVTFTHFVWEPTILAFSDSIFIAWQDDRNHYPSVYTIYSSDSGASWSDEELMDYDCEEPSLAYSNGKARLVINDGRTEPDTDVCCGAYYAEFPYNPDGIIDNNSNALPLGIGLSAYPNPFNSSVLINYSNPNKGGDIAIYNIQGQLIRTFNLTGKEGKIIWDATDASGNTVSSGVYFAKAANKANSAYIKLIYLK